MVTSRPKPPADVARALRRAAGYGCCVCGVAVYQYHHIVPWELEHHFRIEDMMLLCPLCHDAATKGALTGPQQRLAQATPYNVSRGYSAGVLRVNQEFAAIGTGGCLLVGAKAGLSVDGQDLLQIDVDQDGRLLISVDLRDQDDNVLAVIEKNEWISGDASIWDMKSDFQKLQLWTASRQIKLVVDATGLPVWVRADLWSSGQLIQLNAAGIRFRGTGALKDFRFQNLGLVGFHLQLNS